MSQMTLDDFGMVATAAYNAPRSIVFGEPAPEAPEPIGIAEGTALALLIARLFLGACEELNPKWPPPGLDWLPKVGGLTPDKVRRRAVEASAPERAPWARRARARRDRAALLSAARKGIGGARVDAETMAHGLLVATADLDNEDVTRMIRELSHA